jgi:tRNA (cytidine/uridine-2'-O-)-methyltransferase
MFNVVLVEPEIPPNTGWDAKFRQGDYLVFGRETKGLPESLLLSDRENCLTIPMTCGARSLNLATAVAIVLFEGVRQLHFHRE